MQLPTLHSPRFVTSSRNRVGHTPNFDGVLNNGESWTSRRRISEASTKGSLSSREIQEEQRLEGDGIPEEVVPQLSNGSIKPIFSTSLPATLSNAPAPSRQDSLDSANDALENNSNSLTAPGLSALEYHDGVLDIVYPPVVRDLGAVEWSYKDPTGQVQGKQL